MPKKSKPKRTNWKQRALHCEEVIKIQNQVSRSREHRIEILNHNVRYWQELAESTRSDMQAAKARAESAEKQNDLLLEERDDLKHWYDLYVNDFVRKRGELLVKPPTHWQRFKSTVVNWQVELLTVAAVVSALIAYVAFIYRNGGR